MTKRLVLVLGLLGAVVLLATTAQAGLKTHKATNVTISGWSSGPDEDALVQQMVNKFNSTHSSVHATWTVINGNYGDAMTAGSPPTIRPTCSTSTRASSARGRSRVCIQPLNSLVAKSHYNTKAFYPKLLGAFKRGKTIYGFPKDWSPLATEVNNNLFGRAGIKSAPRTWAQLKSDAKTMVAKGVAKHPICLSPDWARMGAFMYQNGGSITSHVTSKANAAAVSYYVGLLKSGLAYTPPSGSWCGQELGQGHAAIIFEGNWLLPYMKSTYPNVHFGIRPMVKGKKQGNLAFTVSWSMAKASQNKQAAWTLLSWMVGKQGEKLWMSKGLALSPRKDVKSIGGRDRSSRQRPSRTAGASATRTSPTPTP